MTCLDTISKRWDVEGSSQTGSITDKRSRSVGCRIKREGVARGFRLNHHVSRGKPEAGELGFSGAPGVTGFGLLNASRSKGVGTGGFGGLGKGYRARLSQRDEGDHPPPRSPREEGMEEGMREGRKLLRVGGRGGGGGGGGRGAPQGKNFFGLLFSLVSEQKRNRYREVKRGKEGGDSP